MFMWLVLSSVLSLVVCVFSWFVLCGSFVLQVVFSFFISLSICDIIGVCFDLVLSFLSVFFHSASLLPIDLYFLLAGFSASVFLSVVFLSFLLSSPLLKRQVPVHPRTNSSDARGEHETIGGNAAVFSCAEVWWSSVAE